MAGVPGGAVSSLVPSSTTTVLGIQRALSLSKGGRLLGHRRRFDRLSARVRRKYGCSTNGLELNRLAEAGISSGLCANPAGEARSDFAPARRVSFSELLGGCLAGHPFLRGRDEQDVGRSQ
jgi:hypothetical protein